MVLTTCAAFVLGAEFQKQKDVQVMKDSKKQVPSSVTAEDNTRTNSIPATNQDSPSESKEYSIPTMYGCRCKLVTSASMGLSYMCIDRNGVPGYYKNTGECR